MNKSIPTPPTISDWLTDATAALQRAHIPTARLDAEVILAHTIRRPRTFLHAHSEEPLLPRHEEIANARIDLRCDRVPVAYIVGHKEFYGRNFKVTTATLIPRPESEALIELLEKALPSSPPPLATAALAPPPASTTNAAVADAPLRLVDVGTGSGALGITAKLEHSELDVTLLDISRHALAVAKENAVQLHASVDLLQSDLMRQYPGVANSIIANLPYVDRDWERSPETNHEPAEALFADNHGLALIFELLAYTPEKLARGGTLILEADPTQHGAIQKEAARHGLALQARSGYGLSFTKLT